MINPYIPHKWRWFWGPSTDLLQPSARFSQGSRWIPSDHRWCKPPWLLWTSPRRKGPALHPNHWALVSSHERNNAKKNMENERTSYLYSTHTHIYIYTINIYKHNTSQVPWNHMYTKINVATLIVRYVACCQTSHARATHRTPGSVPPILPPCCTIRIKWWMMPNLAKTLMFYMVLSWFYRLCFIAPCLFGDVISTFSAVRRSVKMSGEHSPIVAPGKRRTKSPTRCKGWVKYVVGF